MDPKNIEKIRENLESYDEKTKNYKEILKLSQREKKEKIREYNDILKETKNIIGLCKKINNNTVDVNIKGENAKILKEFETRLRKQESLQKNISNSSSVVTMQNNEDIDPDNLRTESSVLNIAKKYQDESIEILRRTEGMMATTEAMGQELALTIQKQTEFIAEIDKEADTLQANIDRAKKDVSYFFRQLSGDKCCIILLVLVILGIFCLVFYLIYKKRKG